MRRISKILATAAIILAPWAVSGTAFAASTCQIGYTGPDSNNLCISETTQVCTVVNNNTIKINSSNEQLSVSGDGLVTDNTSGGSSSSGSASNSNGSTFNVSVKNEVCTVAAVVPATTTPTPTPTPAAGKGAVTPTSKVAVTTLPNASGDVTSSLLVMLASVLGVGALGSYLFTTIYSHRQ